MVRAVVKTQARLKDDLGLATAVGTKLFPKQEAGLIARVVERDLPFYDPALSETAIAKMNQYARDVGLLRGHPNYDVVVATQFRALLNTQDTAR